MTQKIVETFKPFGLYNVDDQKRPYDYSSQRFLHTTQAKQGSGYSFHESVEQYGIWTGAKNNGAHIITIDFDIYGSKGGYNEELETIMNELFESCQFKGVFSSSTEGNYQIVLDIQNIPSLINHIGERKKYSINEGKLNGIEFMFSHNVVIPPTATINKRTGEMGEPREFIGDEMIYELMPCSDLVEFIKDNVPKWEVDVKDTEPKETTIDENDECVAIIKALPQKYLKERTLWIKIGYILKHHGYDVKVFADISRSVPEYRNTEDDVYETAWRSFQNTNITKASLWYWLKQEDENAYKQLRRKFSSYAKIGFEDFLDEDFVEYLQNWIGDLFISKRGNANKPTYYYWNGDIWTKFNIDPTLKQYIVQMGKDVMADLIDIYNKRQAEQNEKLAETTDKDEENQIRKSLKKLLEAHIKQINTVKKCCRMYRKQVDIMKSFKNSIQDDVVVLDGDIEVLNFQNGILNLRNGSFRKRVKEDMVSQTLPYDYKEVSKDMIDRVAEIMKQLQPDIQEYEGMLSWLGYNMTGCVKAQILKFNLGVGSNGKSLTNDLFETTLPLYTAKLDNRTFNEGYTKAHKSLIHLLDKPVRFAYVEEIDTKRLAVDKLKDFTSGRQTIERLYTADECGTIQAKLNINSNYEPTIQSDGGILRRCRMQMYPSRFVDEPEDEGEFKIDRHIIQRFQDNDDLKCALIQLLLPYSMKYFKRGLELPSSWSRNFQEVADDQDVWQEWFEANFEVADVYMCLKRELLECARETFRTATWMEIKRYLKRVNLYQYEKGKMINGERGVCMGFKRRSHAVGFTEELF